VDLLDLYTGESPRARSPTLRIEIFISNTRVALESGYSTPSAFIAMFRKAFGTTPRRYFGTRQ
jgi:AraC-like DNA-binding protein